MRKSIIVIAALSAALISLPLSAQEITEIPEGYELVDSLAYRPVEAVDTTLAGKDIFALMPVSVDGEGADVSINQSPEVADAVRKHIRSNRGRTIKGYRVRIFFDNKQTARAESEKVLREFRNAYPEIAAYRVYANPYFKVTVGDFRTRSEAMEMLSRIKYSFPSAFVVKENIEYPAVDSERAVIVDTIKVLRRK
ncbi:MAG: SPOR domain-containing protein [Bacteroidales bacterium]|nr:SPOR domain-containing protein [Bacteroidales bacterium]